AGGGRRRHGGGDRAGERGVGLAVRGPVPGRGRGRRRQGRPGRAAGGGWPGGVRASAGRGGLGSEGAQRATRRGAGGNHGSKEDGKGTPKKVMAEVIGEAARLGGPVEAVWLTDKATEDGLKQLGSWGATKVWLLENPAFAPYRSEVWAAALAELAAAQSPKAIFGPVTSRQREGLARLGA